MIVIFCQYIAAWPKYCSMDWLMSNGHIATFPHIVASRTYCNTAILLLHSQTIAASPYYCFMDILLQHDHIVVARPNYHCMAKPLQHGHNIFPCTYYNSMAKLLFHHQTIWKGSIFFLKLLGHDAHKWHYSKVDTIGENRTSVQLNSGGDSLKMCRSCKNTDCMAHHQFLVASKEIHTK
jgi:hypothetical protein